MTVLLATMSWGACAGPRDLAGNAYVNVTSDTSSAAKNMALDEARRQIIIDAVGPYADRAQLAAAVKNAKGAALTNLVASSGIDGERLSDTAYAANITMTLDAAAVRSWLAENNVQNWLTDDSAAGDRFIVVATLSDRVANWMDLNGIARAQRIDLNTKNITANQVTLELPASTRSAFTAALRGAGWRYSDADGVLRIWK